MATNTEGAMELSIRNGGVTQGGLNIDVGSNQRTKSMIAYKLNDSAFAVNGSTPTTDTSCTIPSVDRLHIGYNETTGQQFNGHIKDVILWTSRLSNAQLTSKSTAS